MASKRRRDARSRTGESGFTMLELVVVMSIAGVLMSIAGFGLANWQAKTEQRSTADQVLSQLRNASTRSVSEGRTYCVEIGDSGKSYTLWRYACSTAAPAAGAPVHTRVLPARSTRAPHVTLDASVTLPAGTACPTGSRCVYFYPRGTATPAQVEVLSAKYPATVHRIRVEGLTARVYS